MKDYYSYHFILSNIISQLGEIRFNTDNPYANDEDRTQQVTCEPGETVLFKIDHFDTEEDYDFFKMTTGDNNEIMRTY